MILKNHFDLLFPFAFSTDSKHRVTRIGPSLKNLLPALEVGDPAEKHFSFLRPSRQTWQTSNFQAAEDKLQLLQIRIDDNVLVTLRGQVLCEEQTVHFLLSPWLKGPEELDRLNLSINDFAIHDSVNDLMQIVQSHNLATSELEELTVSLKGQIAHAKQIMQSLASLIDLIPSAILLEDSKESVIHVNQAYADIFADRIESTFLRGLDLPFRHRLASHLCENPDDFESRLKILIGEQKVCRGEIIRFNDGRIFERDFSPLILSDGGHGSLWNYRDITELKKNQEAALESSRLKSEFLANMSHEIRTPLNAIMGLTNLVLESSITNEQRENLEAVKLSSDALLNIINDILDFSKIEAGKLDLEAVEFDIHEVLSDCQKIFSLSAEKKNIELLFAEIDLPKRLLIGDPGRFRQILFNLVNNAIKFTQKGSVTITTQLTHLMPSDCRIRVEVKDTGIGIPATALNRLFQAFSQTDQTMARRFGGTGLGLSICKRLAHLMNGEVGVESSESEGSNFWFEIPLALGQQKSLNTPRHQSNTYQGSTTELRILLAEDNPINQMVAGRSLRKYNYKVDVVANGIEVLDAIRTIKYDLILMDCQMPEMDGLEATKIIRTSKTLSEFSKIPIIALTANAIEGDRERCLQAGMNDYAAKPIDFVDLVKKIEFWGRIQNLAPKPVVS